MLGDVETLAETPVGGSQPAELERDRAEVEERTGDVRCVPTSLEQREALLEEGLRPLVVAHGEREVAEVVERQRRDPLVPDRARERDRLLQQRAGTSVIAAREHDRAQVAERVRDVERRVELAGYGESLLRRRRGGRVVPLQQGERSSGGEHAAPEIRIGRLAVAERVPLAAGALPSSAADVPEAGERGRHPQPDLDVARPAR